MKWEYCKKTPPHSLGRSLDMTETHTCAHMHRHTPQGSLQPSTAHPGSSEPGTCLKEAPTWRPQLQFKDPGSSGHDTWGGGFRLDVAWDTPTFQSLLPPLISEHYHSLANQKCYFITRCDCQCLHPSHCEVTSVSIYSSQTVREPTLLLVRHY